jgi:hypothetical protein
VPDGKAFCGKCGLNITAHRQQLAKKKEFEQKRVPQRADAKSAGPKSLKEDKPLGRSLLDAFIYPFRGRGFFIWVVSSLLMIAARFSCCLVTFVFSGFLALYYFDIINKTSSGINEPPDWPDVTNVFPLILATFMTGVLILFSAGPVIFYVSYSLAQYAHSDMAGILARHSHLTADAYIKSVNPFLFFGLSAWAVLYFPMASIMIAETRNMITLLPFYVIKSIFRAPAKYFLLCLCVLGVVLPYYMITTYALLRANLVTQFLLTVPFRFFYVYILFLLARILGIFYKDFIGE